MKNKTGIRNAWRLLLIQLGITALATLILWFWNSTAALSALLGGIVNIIPNALFVLKAFQFQGAQAAKQIVNSFYKGEALKLIIAFILFALVFKYFNVNPLIFFAVYIGVQAVIWFAPLIFANPGSRNK